MSFIRSSGVHTILFRTLPIWVHIELEHTRIINNDINTTTGPVKKINRWN